MPLRLSVQSRTEPASSGTSRERKKIIVNLLDRLLQKALWRSSYYGIACALLSALVIVHVLAGTLAPTVGEPHFAAAAARAVSSTAHTAPTGDRALLVMRYSTRSCE